MIRTRCAAVAAGLLTACSGGGDAGNTQQASVGKSGPAAAAGERSETATAVDPSRGSGLRAQVSDLTAEVSGLNTRMSDMGLVIDLPADALFDFDKATLTPAAEAELRKAAEVIRRSPPGDVRVIGHTDSKGDNAYNLNLSQARAQTVRDWFGEQVGVRQRHFEVSGQGEAAPVAPNTLASGEDNPAGRRKNRRVEVIVPASS
ncbi:OmpA family protein [Sphingomonas piscis]|uniref:OmpA family protein n=1 Tax=Sphingomonas piscis TaxID=2714943 RepID=A0A6G7YPJ2_9SPHN|nr:OmpA family protein [Sphingomonas piscis]QIK78660.1 OmpA family protein [Sphingomonas piscis]